MDAILRVESIAGRRLNDIEVAKADVVIRPQVGRKYWSDFSDLDSIVTEGVSAAEQVIEDIRILRQRSRFFFWKA